MGPNYDLLSLEDLGSLPPVEFLVDGFLPEAGVGMLYGTHASYKSFLALDLGLSVAFGQDWHGRKVKQQKVLYIVGEGLPSFRKRTDAWLAEHGKTPADGADIFLMRASPIDLCSRDEFDEMVLGIAEFQPGLIIIDTLARVTTGHDENSTQDMGLLMANLGALGLDNCGSLLVHHVNKAGTYRGSTAISAACDTMIRVVRKKGDPNVTLHCDKQKDGEEFPPFTLPLIPAHGSLVVGDLTPLARTETLVQLLDTEGVPVAWGRDKVDAWLKENGHTFTQAELRAAIATRKGTQHNANDF